MRRLVLSNGQSVEQPLRGVLVTAVAGVHDAGVDVPREQVGRARVFVPQHDDVGGHRREVARGVEQRLALDHGAGAAGDAERVGAEAFGGELERRARARRGLEEQQHHGHAAQGRDLLDAAVADVLERLGQVQKFSNLACFQRGEFEQMASGLRHWANLPSPLARSGVSSRCTASSPPGPASTSRERDLDGLPALRRHDLAHVVGLDGQLAMPAVHEHRELNPPRTPEVHERVEGGAHGAPGVEHVVHQHERAVRDVEGQVRLSHRDPRPAREGVVAIEGDVERAHRHVQPFGLADDGGEAAGQWQAPRVRMPTRAMVFKGPARSMISWASRRTARRTAVSSRTRRRFGASDMAVLRPEAQSLVRWTAWPRRCQRIFSQGRDQGLLESQESQMNIDLPLMLPMGTKPQKRESSELSRLSPITKTCPSGTFQGRRMSRNAASVKAPVPSLQYCLRLRDSQDSVARPATSSDHEPAPRVSALCSVWKTLLAEAGVELVDVAGEGQAVRAGLGSRLVVAVVGHGADGQLAHHLPVDRDHAILGDVDGLPGQRHDAFDVVDGRVAGEDEDDHVPLRRRCPIA